ncbi:hypothetical protein [Fluviispira multicolorata]|uniref:Uncharacterized protein n=1 Tax=Fluviispira multicolorata TaxID=2654512 RepID=A0A833N4E2_9BACT|nr:hypothetical protein [Fluviispira multicolorata]KAB8030741.1 hypothetical protein GCL57_07145 [Fluviispira multicolorata]
MLNILKCYLGKDNYVDNIICPFFPSIKNSKYIKENDYLSSLKVIKIYEKILPWADNQELIHIYENLSRIIKETLTPTGTLYFTLSSYYSENNRITNYLKLWKQLKKDGDDISFYEKINASEEIKTMDDKGKVVYSAMCSITKDHIEEFIMRNVHREYYNKSFYLSTRDIHLKDEFLNIYNIDNLSTIEYVCRQGDIYFLISGETHNGIYGLDIFGETEKIDLIYEKIMQDNPKLNIVNLSELTLEKIFSIPK